MCVLKCCSVLEAPSASQQVNRKDQRLEASGLSKSYDIHVQNFDVSYGDKYVHLLYCIYHTCMFIFLVKTVRICICQD